MERLFEEFVAGFLCRHADELALGSGRVIVQCRETPRYLLRDERNRGRFQLVPDVMVENAAGAKVVVLDTKWKHLLSDVEDTKNGVKQSDIYQLYAYSHRFDCPDNVLLFPKVPGIAAKRYRIDGSSERRMRIEFLDVSRRLIGNRDALIEDFRQILGVSQWPSIC